MSLPELALVASEMARQEQKQAQNSQQQLHHHHHPGPPAGPSGPHHHHHHVVHHSHPHPPGLAPTSPHIGSNLIANTTLEQLHACKHELTAKISHGKEAIQQLQATTASAAAMLNTIQQAIDKAEGKDQRPETGGHAGKESAQISTKTPLQMAAIHSDSLPAIRLSPVSS